MTDSEVIDVLGGTLKVARDCGASKSMVSNWRKRGVAWRYRGRLAENAAYLKIAIPSSFVTDKII